jgi:hypothetical protein
MGICAVAVELKKINVGLRAIIREIVFICFKILAGMYSYTYSHNEIAR